MTFTLRFSNPEESLPIAMLLSAAGGFLDAFTWVGHGGVFANAQTGNVVLLGLFTAAGQWDLAWRHVPPILAFLAAIFLAAGLRRYSARTHWRWLPVTSLAVEMILLTVVTCLPEGFPDFPIIIGIAFVAALQSASFATIEGWSYSSVMTTGNLRRTAEALFAGIMPPHDPAAQRQARVFATICSTFALGAGMGGVTTARFGNLALISPLLLFLVVLVSCLRATASPPRAKAAGSALE